MSDNHKYPEWFLWFAEHGVRILILLAIAFMAFVYTRSRTNTEERLDAIEDTVKHQARRSYAAPNLDTYAATDVSTRSLPVHQAVYVPVYSHIYYDGGRPYLLEATLSIRNVDPKQPIYVSAVEYYDTDGKLAKTQVDRLDPAKAVADDRVSHRAARCQWRLRRKFHRRVACWDQRTRTRR